MSRASMMYFSREVVIGCVFLIVSLSRGDNTDSATCSRWDTVARTSTRMRPEIKMMCQRNTACTGIDCQGIYSYSYNILGFKLGNDIDFCFGFRVNECDSYTTDVYLQVPNKTVSYVHRLHGQDESLMVPGLEYQPIAGLSYVTVNVFLELSNMVHPQSYYFGADVTVRVNYIGRSTWPENLKRTLVQNQRIVIPNCKLSGRTPPPLPTIGACHPMNPNHTQVVTTTTEHPYTPVSATYGKKCNMHSVFSKNTCGKNEMCYLTTAGQSNSPMCRCVPDAHIGPSGLCEGPPITTTTGKPGHSNSTPNPVVANSSSAGPSSTGKPGHSNSTSNPVVAESSSSGRTAVIAGSVVASVIGIMVLAGVAIFCYRLRKARARYADHEVLLNNEDMVM